MLLINYINKVLTGCKQTKTLGAGVIIMLLAFFLTAGKEINNILGLKRTPIFDISTINLLLLAFFIIFFTGGKITSFKGAVAGLIGILFILCSGKTQIIASDGFFSAIKICMLALSCYGVIQGIRSSKKGRKKEKNKKEKQTLKGFLSEEMAWIIFLILMSIPAAFVVSGVSSYLMNGLLSTVISFGGGEAYITIAETVFVADGSIPSDVFYGQVLPIANALPGPILSKVLAAIGYYTAYHASQSVGAGLLLAIVGYAASIAASCSVFSLILYIYNRFESLEIFQTLKTWILPIVSGLLLTTILSMLHENFNIILEHQGSMPLAIIICGAIFALLMLLHKRYHLHDVILILISGAGSLLVCNLL